MHPPPMSFCRNEIHIASLKNKYHSAWLLEMWLSRMALPYISPVWLSRMALPPGNSKNTKSDEETHSEGKKQRVYTYMQRSTEGIKKQRIPGGLTVARAHCTPQGRYFPKQRMNY